MRPLRLEAEGFTCYRDKQVTLDFSGLSLFAISGPTGAGKSSILDTMLYALYGEVPRIGKQGIGDIISQGRDSLSVCLDFSLRGSVYRVARRVKRSRRGALSTTATLAEIRNGTERNVADNVRPVNDAVAGLLGLDYGAFTQTVILPQGEFARFLRADPKAQREILQHLLRHDVFERMRAEAERRRSAVDVELRGVEGRLETYKDATDDVLTAKGRDLATARQLLERVSDERTGLDREVQESRRRRQLTEELSRLRGERSALDLRDPEIVRARTEVARARRAAEIAPRLEACKAATSRAEQGRKDLDSAARTNSEATGRQAVAERKAATAVEAAEQCSALNERIQLLDELKGDLERRETLATDTERLTTQMSSISNTATEAQGALEVARAAEREAGQRLEQVRATYEGSVYDEALDALLEKLWTHVVQVRSTDEEVERLQGEESRLSTVHDRAEHDERAARETHVQAAQWAGDAGLAARNAASAFDEGQTRHQAAALRAHLHAGEDCPVCLQPVTGVPTGEPPPELAALAKRRDAEESRAREATRKLESAREALAAAETRLSGAVDARDACASRLQERVIARDSLRAEVIVALAQTSANLSGTDALSWIETQRSELRDARKARDRVEVLFRQAEGAAGDAKVKVATAEGTANQANERVALLAERLLAARTELDIVAAHVVSVSSHPDPRAERDELATRVATLRNAEGATRAALETLRQEVAATLARLAALTTAAANAEADATTARVALDDALGSAGFAVPDEATAAIRSVQQQTELDSTIRQHDAARAAVSRRLLEIEPEIGGKEVDARALAAAEERFAGSVTASREAELAVSRLDAERSSLADAVEKRTQLVAERDVLRGRLSVTGEMAADLKGDSFQQYLLEEAFRSLVNGASVRMREISNRYTLEWNNGDFYVVDHDNAGDRRRAETLSGGETFMASLCLALQLSDEVLRTSGALQMDSLFIDEGFGTLDVDSLSDVTDAMEALRQEGGRLIGVISHRPELTDRLPGCVRVDKGAGESRWILERVG